MTKEERCKIAVEYKKQMNCCQAVTKAFSDMVSLDENTLQNISSGFESGMGSLEGTCGALVGANIIAGLFANGNGTIKISRELSKDFLKKCGATTCKDLKGVTTGSPLCSCDKCVENAVLSLCQIIENVQNQNP